MCQKVEKKQITSYNEVADELVNDYWREKAMGITDVVRTSTVLKRTKYKYVKLDDGADV